MLAGLEISNFKVIKRRFEQVQATYFENGFRKKKVIVSSNSQSSQKNPIPQDIYLPPWAEQLQISPLKHINSSNSVLVDKWKESDIQGIKVQVPTELLKTIIV